jgi:hypothetical protein
MLEQAYTDQTSEKIIEAAPKAEPNKKRKADGGAKSATAPGEDDDDDVYYAGVGKKARGGIGYAGNVREDVSSHLTSLISVLTILVRLLDNWRLKQRSMQKMRRSVLSSLIFTCICHRFTVKAGDKLAITLYIQLHWLTFEGDSIPFAALS